MSRIGTHSLRAPGAMALKLQGVSDSTIMKIGRWTGLTFLTYIHTQTGALIAGLSQQMATRIECRWRTALKETSRLKRALCN
jgi:hypothetical protein